MKLCGTNSQFLKIDNAVIDRGARIAVPVPDSSARSSAPEPNDYSDSWTIFHSV